MKLTKKLYYIIFSSLPLGLYCAEKKYKTEKIAQKPFSTGTTTDKRKAIFEERKRIKHIATVEDCINAQRVVPTKIIFAADHDITEKALRHNQGLFDQALHKK